jgi:hypothetical protein
MHAEHMFLHVYVAQRELTRHWLGHVDFHETNPNQDIKGMHSWGWLQVVEGAILW